MSNNGRQKKTTLKYLLYLYVLIRDHNIVNTDKINIKDNELMKTFNISPTDSDFHQHLEELGILTCVDDTFWVGYGDTVPPKTMLYSVNMEEYEKQLKQKIYLYPNLLNIDSIKSYLSDLDNRFYLQDKYYLNMNLFSNNPNDSTFNIRKVEDDPQAQDFLTEGILEIMNRESCTYTYDINSDTVLDSSHTVFTTNADKGFERYSSVLKQFSSVELKDYDTFFTSERWIKCKTELEGNDWKIIKDAYVDCVKSTTVLAKIIEVLNTLKNDFGYEDSHCKINVSIKKGAKGGFYISNSGRQNNSLCQLTKAERKEQNIANGFDSEFDIHSTIYAFARLMNFGIFDADWDIKTELLNTDTYPLIDGTLLDRNGLKAVSYRTFFTKSFEDSYNKYKNAYEGKVFKKGGKRRVLTEKEEEKRKALPIMSKSVFKKLYDNCQKLIGGSEKYVYTIFYIESLIECRVIYQMLRKRYEVRNVYDCFYFKSSQTTETEIKQIITNCAIEVYKELKQPSLWW